MPRAFRYALAAAITLSILWSSLTTIRASLSARSSSDGADLAIVSFADGFFGLATGFGFAAIGAVEPLRWSCVYHWFPFQSKIKRIESANAATAKTAVQNSRRAHLGLSLRMVPKV